MCFSPEADLVSGIVIGAIGIEAFRHVARPAERALAAVPVVLGVHQLVEAVVWWALRGDLPQRWVEPAATVYLLIAFGVLPILVPAAVGALEPASNRRRLAAFTALGMAVSAVLVHAIVRGPVVAVIDGHHISYRVDLWRGGLIVACYVVATCGALLVSAHRHVRWFGLVNLVIVASLVALDRNALISLWCAWAAVTSIAISVHLRCTGGTEADPVTPTGSRRPAPAG
jgi:hypothetical protein